MPQGWAVTWGCDRLDPAIYGSPCELSGCRADARDVARLLAERGFTIVGTYLDSDVTYDNLAATIARLASLAEPGDIVVNWISTHGTLVEDLSGDERRYGGMEAATCLYDGLCVDDWRFDMHRRFKPAVRFVSGQDTCHAQDSLRAIIEGGTPYQLIPAAMRKAWRAMAPKDSRTAPVTRIAGIRALPPAAVEPAVEEARRHGARPRSISAGVVCAQVALEACTREQTAADMADPPNGLFTASVKAALAAGAVSYRDLIRRAAVPCRGSQTPVLSRLGSGSLALAREAPFRIAP